MQSTYFQHPELDGLPFFMKKGKTGILFIHGFTATCVEVRSLADYLFDCGFTVAGPLLPGHGTHPADLNSRKWSEWVTSAEILLDDLFDLCNNVIVCGESMGAVISLYLAHYFPKIHGIMLYSPALKVNSLKYARYFSPFIPYMRKNNNDDTMAWQGYTVFPLKAANEFYKLQKQVQKMLPTIVQPTLIIQGKLDRTIDPHGAQIIFDLISSEKKKLVWLENSSHCLLLDQESGKAQKESEDFLESILDPNNRSE